MRISPFPLLRPAIAICLCAAIAASAPAEAQLNAFKDPVASGGSAIASGPDLKPVSPTVTGGAISVGATAYVVTVFKNSGTSAVNVTGVNLYPSSTVTSQVSLNKCAEAPLPPEAECAITLSVTGVQSGAWRVELLVDHDGRTRLATAAVTGTVESAGDAEEDVVKADVEPVPAELDFGTATGSVPLVRSILLRNRTAQPVNLKNVSLDTPAQTGFTFKPDCPETLQPSETCSVLLTWSPLTRGLSQGVLNVMHTARSALTQVQVKGTFEPSSSENAKMYPESVPEKGLLIADKDKIDFGDGIKGASAITLSLVNVGTEDVTLKSIKLSGSDSGVSVARAGCRSGSVLKALEACALTVNWLPSREGAVIDDLQIHHTGARGVLLLPVRGEADAAISRESLAVRQTTVETVGADGVSREEVVSVTPVLDGYVVTTHSPTKAIINGPVGRIVVRDGEDTVISGVKWTVTIVSTGVILTSAEDEILLVFDKSLKPLQPTTTSDSSSEEEDSSTETTTTTSTE